jgi:predicted dehydrogenase
MKITREYTNGWAGNQGYFFERVSKMKLKFGIVGGGGGFIGNVHRHGALMDDLAVLTAGCFSRNADTNHKYAKRWGVAESNRIYADYEEMAAVESAREDGIDFVSITTPNDTHYPIVKSFLQHGIHVMCDKPLALTAEQADIAQSRGVNWLRLQRKRIFCAACPIHTQAMPWSGRRVR